jgi:hypothetical protein
MIPIGSRLVSGDMDIPEIRISIFYGYEALRQADRA